MGDRCREVVPRVPGPLDPDCCLTAWFERALFVPEWTRWRNAAERILGEVGAAEDAVEDACRRLLTSRAGELTLRRALVRVAFDEQAARRYVVTCVLNEARDACERRARGPSACAFDGDDGEPPLAPVVAEPERDTSPPCAGACPVSPRSMLDLGALRARSGASSARARALADHALERLPGRLSCAELTETVATRLHPSDLAWLRARWVREIKMFAWSRHAGSGDRPPELGPMAALAGRSFCLLWHVLRALASSPRKPCLFLALFYSTWRGHKGTEVASALGRSADSVHDDTRKARQFIREAYEGDRRVDAHARCPYRPLLQLAEGA